jgi:nitrous oxidase accessory protein NosD
VSSTYTATSGTWNGIRYYSGSSGTIQYANINNAYVGIYANNSSPSVSYTTINNCTYGVRPYYSNISVSHSTISNCTYGVYLRYSNAGITRNAITGCTRGVYGYYADYTDIVNNLITSGASSRVAGVQVYDTDEPNLYNNTIEGSFTYGLDADHYSRTMAIGPGSQNYQGYNRILGGSMAT